MITQKIRRLDEGTSHHNYTRNLACIIKARFPFHVPCSLPSATPESPTSSLYNTYSFVMGSGIT